MGISKDPGARYRRSDRARVTSRTLVIGDLAICMIDGKRNSYKRDAEKRLPKIQIMKPLQDRKQKASPSEK